MVFDLLHETGVGDFEAPYLTPLQMMIQTCPLVHTCNYEFFFWLHEKKSMTSFFLMTSSLLSNYVIISKHLHKSIKNCDTSSSFGRNLAILYDSISSWPLIPAHYVLPPFQRQRGHFQFGHFLAISHYISKLIF